MSNRHLEVTVDRAARLVRVRRTEAPLTSAGDIADMVVHLRKRLVGVARGDFAVLFDLRPASLADESTYGTEMAALRREVVRGFWRAALVVETSTGLLQVQRFVRLEKLAASVFENEVKALVFLDQKGRSTPPSST